MPGKILLEYVQYHIATAASQVNQLLLEDLTFIEVLRRQAYEEDEGGDDGEKRGFEKISGHCLQSC
jgi:hypothetical protein